MGLEDIFDKEDLIYYVDPSLANGVLSNPQTAPQGAVFFSINPLDNDWAARAAALPHPPVTPRFSLNVSKYRNFVFESDTGTLEQQLLEWHKVAELIPIKMLTYSGGKSYHAIISILDTWPLAPYSAESVTEYKRAWKGLKGFIETHSKLTLDPSTKDPSRLTRIPNALRGATRQAPISICSRYICYAEVLEHAATFAPQPQTGLRTTNGPASAKVLEVLLKQRAHKRLRNKIVNPAKWASSTNMYPEVLRLTLWAIDELNPDPHVWLSMLEKTVFPTIKATGYPRDLALGVRNAYAYKGIHF